MADPKSDSTSNHKVMRDSITPVKLPAPVLILVEHVKPDTFSLAVVNANSKVTSQAKFDRWQIPGTQAETVEFTKVQDKAFYALIHSRFGAGQETDTLETQIPGQDLTKPLWKTPGVPAARKGPKTGPGRKPPPEPKDKVLKQEIADILKLEVTEPKI
jgi:hypothetical protein